MPDLQNLFYATLVETLETEVAVHGYAVVLESSHADAVCESDHLRSIPNRHVDGILCILTDNERNLPILREYGARGKAIVMMHESGVSDIPVDAVTVDFRAGTTQAIRYLVGLGHQKVAFLLAVCDGQREGDRPEAFQKMMMERGFRPRMFPSCAATTRLSAHGRRRPVCSTSQSPAAQRRSWPTTISRPSA